MCFLGVDMRCQWSRFRGINTKHSTIIMKTEKTVAQIKYEKDLLEKPFYHDGSPRKTWAELGSAERSTWGKSETPKTAHTPGPWFVFNDGYANKITGSPSPQTGAPFIAGAGTKIPEQKANVLLMSKAPEMKEILESFCAAFHLLHNDMEAVERIDPSTNELLTESWCKAENLLARISGC